MIRAMVSDLRQSFTDAKDQFIEAGPERIMRGLVGAGAVWIGWDNVLFGLLFGVVGFTAVFAGGLIYNAWTK